MLVDLKTVFYNIFSSIASFSPVLVLVVPMTLMTIFTGVATFTHLGRYHGIVGGVWALVVECAFGVPSQGRALAIMNVATLFLLLATMYLKLHPRRLLVTFVFLTLFFTNVPAHGLTMTLLPFFVFNVSCS